MAQHEQVTPSTGDTQIACPHDPTFGFNPFVSPDLEDPHTKLAAARRECPVFYSEGLKTWVVTRYRDITTVLADPSRFSSAAAITNVPAPPPAPILEVLGKGIRYEGGMVDMDPPVHTVYRRLFNRAFTPPRIAAMEPRIREIVEDLVGSFADKGSGDLVSEVAYPLPMRVMARVFGFPDADMDDVKRWSDQWLVLLGQRGTMEEVVAAAEEVVAFQRYIHDLLAERREHPGDDLTGDLFRAVAELDDQPTTNSLVGVVMVILFAGHETTTTLIGDVILQLLAHPDQLEMLRADPSLIPAAVVETLRLDPPAPGMYRTTTEAVQVGDVSLPAGTHIQLSYVSANRDEEVFSDPDRFDITRGKDQQHLSFGRGIHYCIGAPLAQMEARIAVESLIKLPNLRLMVDRPVRPVQSATVRGNESIWLEWDR